MEKQTIERSEGLTGSVSGKPNGGGTSVKILKPSDLEGDFAFSTYDAFAGKDLLSVRQEKQIVKQPSRNMLLHHERLTESKVALVAHELDEAYDLISSLFDTNIDEVERSNNFDAWKDKLLDISEMGISLSLWHRQILGGLIAGVNEKEIYEFTDDVIKTFRDATYRVRQRRVSYIDANRTIKELMQKGVSVEMPLAIDSLSEEQMLELEELETELAGIIGKE